MTKKIWQGGWGILIIIGILFFLSNLRQWRQYRQLRQAKKTRQQEVARLEAKKRQLQEQLQVAQTPDFIRQELRRHLGWGEPGEVIVDLPPLKITPTPTPRHTPWQLWRQQLRW